MKTWKFIVVIGYIVNSLIDENHIVLNLNSESGSGDVKDDSKQDEGEIHSLKPIDIRQTLICVSNDVDGNSLNYFHQKNVNWFNFDFQVGHSGKHD